MIDFDAKFLHRQEMRGLIASHSMPFDCIEITVHDPDCGIMGSTCMIAEAGTKAVSWRSSGLRLFQGSTPRTTYSLYAASYAIHKELAPFVNGEQSIEKDFTKQEGQKSGFLTRSPSDWTFEEFIRFLTLADIDIDEMTLFLCNSKWFRRYGRTAP